MDDIGNLVYVLLIILFGVFQLFASKKKKQDQGGGGESKSPFDDIFGELGEDQQDEEPATNRETPEKRVVEESNEYDPYRSFEDADEVRSEREKLKDKPVNEYMEYLEERKDDLSDHHLDTEVETPELEVIDRDGKKKKEFDLKKAVIYSTILERKFKI